MKKINVADLIINFVLLILAILGIVPFINTIALSLSDKASVQANLVGLYPIGLHFENYKEILLSKFFFQSYMIGILRVIVGVFVQIFIIVISGYPLAMEKKLPYRNAMIVFIIIPMLFSGGLIPSFLVVKGLGLLNTFASLILPIAVQIFSIIIYMNYIRGLPSSLIESASLDGANHYMILFKIILPISMPSIATLILFSFVMHWNSWFDALIYINDIARWPIQAVMRSLIVGQIDVTKAFDVSQLKKIAQLSDVGFKAAAIIITIIPLLLIYPFLQKYYVKGLVIGAVKG